MLAEQFAVMDTSVILASELRISVQCCHSSHFVNKLWKKQKKRRCVADTISDTAVYLDIGMQLGVVYTDKSLAQLGMCKSYLTLCRIINIVMVTPVKVESKFTCTEVEMQPDRLEGMLKPVFIHFILISASQLWLNGCVLLTDCNRNHLETLSL